MDTTDALYDQMPPPIIDTADMIERAYIVAAKAKVSGASHVMRPEYLLIRWRDGKISEELFRDTLESYECHYIPRNHSRTYTTSELDDARVQIVEWMAQR